MVSDPEGQTPNPLPQQPVQNEPLVGFGFDAGAWSGARTHTANSGRELLGPTHDTNSWSREFQERLSAGHRPPPVPVCTASGAEEPGVK